MYFIMSSTTCVTVSKAKQIKRIPLRKSLRGLRDDRSRNLFLQFVRVDCRCHVSLDMAPKKPAAKAKEAKKPEAMEVDNDGGDKSEEAAEEAPDFPKLMRDNLTTLVRAIELDDKNLIRRVWRRTTVTSLSINYYVYSMTCFCFRLCEKIYRFMIFKKS